MASNRIEFEMTLKELNFKFKGDFEQGQRIQAGISRALGDIASIQNSVTGAKPPALIDVPSSTTPTARRSKKRRKTQDESGEGEQSGVNGNGSDSQPQNGESAPRRTGVSPTELLKGLRKAGFFEEAKTSSAILSHLNTKGHTNIAGSDLTSPLSSLCKKDILVRNKPDGKVWHYGNGPKDE
jgi:hypothetical protein